VNSEAVSRIPKCPACGNTVAYIRINPAKPFQCPSCNRQLVTSEEYSKRLRFFCMTVTVALAGTFGYQYWISAPITNARFWYGCVLSLLTFLISGFVVTCFGVIFAKRIFPPTLEDYEEYSKRPHYTAL
jgi:uncharacterized membrane protein (DUF485 family)